MEIGPSSWVSCTYQNFLPSRDILSAFVRGLDNLSGRKVYELEVVSGCEDFLKEQDVLCKITGKVVGGVLGTCQDFPVLVMIEAWSAKSDGWELGTWQVA